MRTPEQRKIYMSEYNARPEVIAHKKEYDKEYNARPEVIAHKKEYIEEYSKIHREEKNARNREQYKENREEILRKQKEYLATPEGQANRKITLEKSNAKPEIIARHRTYAKEHKKLPEIKLRDKELRLERDHNLPIEEWDRMFEEQHGCCDICGRPATDFKKGLALDHNHITGKIRKLLCPPCNLGLGIYQKKKDLFEKYLKNNPQ